MARFSPVELQERMTSGLLSFPVTHTRTDYSLDEDGYREHLQWLGGHGAAAWFAAGGTGEFFALSLSEVRRVIELTVEERQPETPVIAAAGYGTTMAVELATSAEEAGADGILLFPPYLTEVSQAGLYEHVSRVCTATGLGVTVYHRANARFAAPTVERLANEHENFIGIKDGVCDIDLLARLRARVGDRLAYIGGLPTAETYALPYQALGASTYSSAIFNFLPEWAMSFYRSVRAGDTDDVHARLRDFVVPYLDIRDRNAGYAVAIVKAGMTAVGRSAGPVRPPLSDLTDEELADLTELVKKVA